MKKYLFVLIFALIAGNFTWPPIVSACSCTEPPGIEEELSRSDAVFSGKVISITKKPALFSAPTQTIIFQVENTWKGIDQSQAKIVTGQGGGDCGFDFKLGQEYLVYAVKSNMYGPYSLSTIICDRTDILSQAQGDMAILGKGQAPTEEVDLLKGNMQWYLIAGLIGIVIIAFIVYRRRKKID